MNGIRQKTIFPTNGGEFPLILGRDFSGEVVETGRDVRKFQRGDEVSTCIFILIIILTYKQKTKNECAHICIIEFEQENRQ